MGTIAFLVRGLEGAVEQVGDLFRRGLAAQRHDDRRDQAAQEAGDDFIQAGRRGQERIPQGVDREAHAHAGDCAGIRQAAPVEREQDDRAERGAEARPCALDERHDAAAVRIGRDEVRDDGDEDDDDAADPLHLVVGGVLADDWLIDIGGEGAAAREQLGVRRAHGRGQNGREKHAGDERREQAAHHVHKDEVLVVDLAEELAADQADDGGHGQDDQDPAAADDLALAHLMLGLDGQIAHKDVRHAEVAQAPAKTGNDIRHALPVEAAAGEHIIVVFRNGHDRCDKVCTLHDEQREDRREHERGKHEHALEEVRPAHGVEAAEKHVHEDDGRSDDHGRLGAHARDGVEQRAAGRDARGAVNAIDHDEHDRRDDLQALVLRLEAIGEKLRDRDRIVRADGIPAQTRRDKHPRADRADDQTDGDPHLTDAVQIDRAGQAHEHPRAHIRRTGRQRRDPAAHAAATEEILFFTLYLAIPEEEIHTDADDQRKVKQNGDPFTARSSAHDV